MEEAAEVGLDESYPELLVVEYLRSKKCSSASSGLERINIERLEDESRDRHQQDSIAR